MNFPKDGKRMANFNKAYKNAKAKQARQIKKKSQETGEPVDIIEASYEHKQKMGILNIPSKKDLIESIEKGSIANYNAIMKLLTAYTDRNANKIKNPKSKIPYTNFEYVQKTTYEKIIKENENVFLEKLNQALSGEFLGQYVFKLEIQRKIDAIKWQKKSVNENKLNAVNKEDRYRMFKLILSDLEKRATNEYDFTLQNKHVRKTLYAEWVKNFGTKSAKILQKKADKVGYDNIRILQIGGVAELENGYTYPGSDNPEMLNATFENISNKLDEILNFMEKGY